MRGDRTTFLVRLVTPEGIFFEKACSRVNFKAGEGEITLQRSQGEFLTNLKPGPIIIRDVDGLSSYYFDTPNGGIAYLRDDILTLSSLKIIKRREERLE